MSTCSGACCTRDLTRRTTPIPSGPRSTRSPSTHSCVSPPVHRSSASTRPAPTSCALRSSRWPWTSLTTKRLPIGPSLQHRLPSPALHHAESSGGQPLQRLEYEVPLGRRPHRRERCPQEAAVARGDQARVEDRHDALVAGGADQPTG